MNEDTGKLIINIIVESRSHFDSVSRSLGSKFVASVEAISDGIFSYILDSVS